MLAPQNVLLGVTMAKRSKRADTSGDILRHASDLLETIAQEENLSLPHSRDCGMRAQQLRNLADEFEAPKRP